MRFLAAALGASMLLLSAPAQPQGTAFTRDLRAIDRLLSEAESARLNGDCELRDRKLVEAQTRIASAYNLSDAGRSELNLLLAEARARPCPPGASSTPPPPAEAVQPPAPTTEPVPPADQTTEPPAPTPPPTPTPIAPAAQRTIDRVERAFADAENARMAGDCAARDAALARVRDTTNAMEGSGEIDVGLIENWRRRLAVAKTLRCPPGTPRDLRVGFLFGGGYGESEIPRVNYGFNRDGPAGTEEQPAGFSERTVPGLMFVAGAQFPRIGHFTIGYREGDASNRTDIGPSTNGGAQGVVGTTELPGGNTGVTANLGVSVVSSVSFHEYDAGYRYVFGDGDDQAALDQGQVALSGLAGIDVRYRERDHEAEVSITRTTPPPISVVQTLDQRVDELEVAAVVGAEAVIPLGTRARFTLGGEIGGYLYDYDLRSTETRVQPGIGPVADQDYTLRIDDDEGGVAYSAEIRGEFVIDVSGRPIDGQHRGGVELFAGGGGRFLSDRAQVVNPFSGDFVLAGGTTFLDTDHAFDWRVFAGLRYTFGQPPQPGSAR